ncbi:ribosomal protein S18-alanine N-acetyltransferase [Chitinilyticum piscinae]|uniref:[Ribosomal protein bS18]-alanine N-acetyltransferase n=1 Tax=Chitinilyticum piscinae TaxID=2866724 RepID=A0A8J7FN27_9NEIS|nr:ribosomal protein S18-alanine N-acetyltransferase [Chitinilyticum piscinae]MBE9609661.1 ribosomal protein S18-alanine N-acetyltransferase [Chitinilyticum piscinae]
MLRTLTEADLPALLALDAATNNHPWSESSWRSSLAGHLCLGLFTPGRLAGFCVVMPLVDEAELLLIAVAPELQRQGHASTLLQAAMVELQQRGMVQLFLEVRAGNCTAQAFYARHGFVQTGLRKGYYPLDREREDALIYTLDSINCGAMSR